jgi:sec-independent protein translocase protein TatB
MAQTARTELKAELGDTVGEFDFSDLNPRTFVRKHLLDDLDADLTAPTATASPAAAARPAGTPTPLTVPAPYDLDAT